LAARWWTGDNVTRSGTNQIHGSVFENVQSQSLNSRDPFLAAKVPYTYNQFGGSAGGPIKKNKIFVFGGYEGYRQDQQQRLEITVPTQATRTQVLTAQPVYANAFTVVPLPNQPFDANATTGLFDQLGSAVKRDNHIDLKGDIRITDNSNLSLTYTHGRPFGQSPSGYIGNDAFQYAFTDRGTASYVIGGASWTAETRFGYNRNDAHTFDQDFENVLPGPAEVTKGGRRLGGWSPTSDGAPSRRARTSSLRDLPAAWERNFPGTWENTRSSLAVFIRVTPTNETILKASPGPTPAWPICLAIRRAQSTPLLAMETIRLICGSWVSSFRMTGM